MAISIEAIKALRERTSAGVMDCRNALGDAQGDMEKAVTILHERGFAAAAKRAGRETRQGLLEAYVHDGRIGAMVEINCETDFVARTDLFRTLAHDIAMQIASMNPRVIAVEDVPADADGPAEEQALLAQPFIKDPSKRIRDLINEAVVSTGEQIRVRRFTRYVLGD